MTFLRQLAARRKHEAWLERQRTAENWTRIVLDVILFLLPPIACAGSAVALFTLLALCDWMSVNAVSPLLLLAPPMCMMAVLGASCIVYEAIQRCNQCDAGSFLYRQHLANRFSCPWFMRQVVESGIEFHWWFDENGAAVASRAHYCPGGRRRIVFTFIMIGLVLAQVVQAARWLGGWVHIGGIRDAVAILSPGLWACFLIAVFLHVVGVPLGWRPTTFPRARLIIEVSLSALLRALHHAQVCHRLIIEVRTRAL